MLLNNHRGVHYTDSLAHSQMASSMDTVLEDEDIEMMGSSLLGGSNLVTLSPDEIAKYTGLYVCMYVY